MNPEQILSDEIIWSIGTKQNLEIWPFLKSSEFDASRWTVFSGL